MQFPCEVAQTLALPLVLCAIFEPRLQGYLPDILTGPVRSECAFVPRHPVAGSNPVEKFPIITGAEGEIYIDEIGADLDQAGCLVVVYARWYHKGNRQQMEHNDD